MVVSLQSVLFMEVSKFKTLLGLTIVLPLKFGKIWSDKYSTLRVKVLLNTRYVGIFWLTLESVPLDNKQCFGGF